MQNRYAIEVSNQFDLLNNLQIDESTNENEYVQNTYNRFTTCISNAIQKIVPQAKSRKKDVYARKPKY